MLRGLPNNIKFILAIAGILAIGLIAYGIYQKVVIAGNVAVTINLVPSDATLTVNGKSVSTSGTIYLAPNQTYTIQASKDGFATFNDSKYIDASNNSINIALTAVSDAAKQWVQNNQDLYQNNEGQAGAAATSTGEAFAARNPITQYLPLDNLVYSIGYRNDPSDPSGNSIIITIDAPEGYRNSAIEKIRSLGYDPTQFKIEFNNYQNPFAL